MTRLRDLLLALALVLSGGSLVHAQDAGEPIGQVKTVGGTAWVVTGAANVPAAPGTPVYVGSVLRTGPKASLGVALRDNTLLSLGGESELALDEFRFAPARTSLGLVARIGRGTLEFVSGMIAKLRPESVQVKTPTGTLGVRGTRFLVKVDE